MQEFPEVDRGEWFAPEIGRRKILAGQVPLIDQLLELLGSTGTHASGVLNLE
jgi:predicted NUDIX family NTP pyrophosphohydrolase